MRIKSLKIKNFRNLHDTQLEPGPHLNLFLGGNAQGKTSVLESIYFSAQLKSFRTNSIKELIQFEKEEAQIESQFLHKTDENEARIRFGLENKVTLNNKKISKIKFLGKINAVTFNPDSLQTVKQGPEKRRELVDEAAALIFKEAYFSQKQLERILKQKNTVLKSIKTGEMNLKQARQIIESLNEVLIPISADVLYLRLKIIDELTPRIIEILSEIIGKKTNLKILNKSQGSVWEEKKLDEITERIGKEIRNPTSCVIEEATGFSVAGPHRQEINFIFNNYDARVYCSQGQQRALILAFKIAQIVYHGEALESFPLLLLDDVLSEFDENKQRYLLDFLQKNEAQTFLTATDAKGLLKDARIFHLDAGKVMKNAD